MIEQLSFLQSAPRFDGETFDPAKDGKRLETQLHRVRTLMLDGRWRTLKEIAKATGASEAAASARLRDLRKSRFGRFTVERRARAERSRGVFEYRVSA